MIIWFPLNSFLRCGGKSLSRWLSMINCQSKRRSKLKWLPQFIIWKRYRLEAILYLLVTFQTLLIDRMPTAHKVLSIFYLNNSLLVSSSRICLKIAYDKCNWIIYFGAALNWLKSNRVKVQWKAKTIPNKIGKQKQQKLTKRNTTYNIWKKWRYLWWLKQAA